MFDRKVTKNNKQFLLKGNGSVINGFSKKKSRKYLDNLQILI